MIPTSSLSVNDIDVQNSQRVDRLLVMVMIAHWLGGVLLSVFGSPSPWIQETDWIQINIWAAATLGGLLTITPVMLGVFWTGTSQSRHVMAISMAIWGVFFLHLSGGRLEAHFYAFCALGVLSLYRDKKVLMTFFLCILAAHLIGGQVWPGSILGADLPSSPGLLVYFIWLTLELIFLATAIQHSKSDIRRYSNQANDLSQLKIGVEDKLHERTAELKSAKEFFYSVFQSLDSQVCILNEKGVVIDLNDGWKSEKRAPEIGENFLEFCRSLPKGSGRNSPEELVKAIEWILDGREDQFSLELQIEDGESEKWSLVNVVPLKKSHPIELRVAKDVAPAEIGGVIVSLHEITDRVDAENRLNSTSLETEKLALVAKYTDNLVVITDAQGKIEWVNEGFETVTEFSLDEVVGLKPGSFLQGPDTDRESVAFMRERILHKQGFDIEIVNYSKSGRKYWLAIEARPIRNADGDVTHFIAIESDISDRKQAEQDQQKLLNKLKFVTPQAGLAEVSNSVMHNVGSLLTSVNISARTMLSYNENNGVDRLRKACDAIRNHEDNLHEFLCLDDRGRAFPRLLSGIVTTLRTEQEYQNRELASLMANIEHIKEIIRIQQSTARKAGIAEPVDLSEIIHHSVKLTYSMMKHRQIDVSTEVEEVPSLMLEKHHVLQILLNLIRNSCEALERMDSADKKLVISLKQVEQSIEISVSDTGEGISEENMDRVFQHGFTTRQSADGNGLHASATSAECMGGSLSVHSEGPFRGTVVTLRLPIQTALFCQT